jgi:Cys-tRNA(Pro)/Cys-tRNA(Cys) deacylase
LLNKGFQVVLDAQAREQVELHVSGGQRGLNIRLPVEDFIHVTNARVAPVSRPEPV